jgi:hypothetical protein
VVVTQKLAAQAVPVIGALGGAAVNYAFIDHFQEVARAHFVVRKLERRYGKDIVREVAGYSVWGLGGVLSLTMLCSGSRRVSYKLANEGIDTRRTHAALRYLAGKERD